MKSKLFPIYFKRKEYNEKDCHHTFLNIYTREDIFVPTKGILLFDNCWITPDGVMYDSPTTKAQRKLRDENETHLLFFANIN